MRKLIIGCGYLGERVAQKWLDDGCEIYALTRSKERAASLAGSGLNPVVGDVLDCDSLKALPHVETILYAVGFDRASGRSKRMVYVDGLRNVLRAVRGKCQRLVYVSSISVYGQNSGELVDESSAVSPYEENGCICRDAEAVVWDQFRSAKPDTEAGEAIVLRLAGIYGPGRLLARADQLRRGDLLSGNPDAWLNLIHVEDAVQAALAAEERGQSGETYLVCDDRPLRRREYFTALAEKLGVAPPSLETLAVDAPELHKFGKRCVNRRMREELRVELQFPTISEGLSHLFSGQL
jgi:nucleoside-diphosphate-sugar epimerase